MSVITIYGIANCDTIKRTRAWFVEHQVQTQFHDYKKLGVPEAELARWVDALGWQVLLNRQGTTWRKLTPEQQATAHDAPSAIQLMLAQASLIKRPVVTRAGVVIVGYAPDKFASLS
jgi:arsenate reductase (glutaredoxin)